MEIFEYYSIRIALAAILIFIATITVNWLNRTDKEDIESRKGE